MEIIKSMEIDEEKQQEFYKIECQSKQIKKTYSNHNSILINVDFISPKDVSRKKKVITRWVRQYTWMIFQWQEDHRR